MRSTTAPYTESRLTRSVANERVGFPVVEQVVYFGGFFSQTGIFTGFSLQIINLAVRISAAAMALDIIFISLAGPVGYYTGAHTVIFAVFFSLYYSPEGRA